MTTILYAFYDGTTIHDPQPLPKSGRRLSDGELCRDLHKLPHDRLKHYGWYPVNATIPSYDARYQRLEVQSKTFDTNTETVTVSYSVVPIKPLADWKAEAKTLIDQQAEKVRQAYITPGAGQAMEYLQTKEEAEKHKAAGYPQLDAATYPLLKAEYDAQVAADPSVTPQQITDFVLTEYANWTTIGSNIKAIRRKHKVAINNATDHATVAAELDAALAALEALLP